MQNDGNGESAATTLRYFRSTDATITTSDTEVGTDAVAGLAPSGSDSQSVELAAPSAPGTYHYGACVDAVAGESDTANNCSPSVQVTVREPDHPDLTVVSPSVSDNSPAAGVSFTLSATVQTRQVTVLQTQQQLQSRPDLEVGTPTVSDDSPAPGASFTLSATVQNDGNGESAATTLRYFRSPDATITTSDTEVGTDAVAGLARSGSDRQSVDVAAPSAPGPYYYGACVDVVAGESNTANNCSPSVQVTVLQTQQQLQSRPDLEVGTPTVSDDSPAPGASFTLSATVQNDGNGESAATTLRYFRSPDATITTSDTEVGTDAVAGLAPSGSDRQSVDVAAPSAPGPYYYGACVDAVAGESNTANNCSTSVQVTVLQTQQQLQSRPDLEVGTPTVSDDSPAPGASFTLSATVQNDGNGESAATTLRYFRSPDATITTSDTEVGTDAVAGLARSGSDRQSVDVAAPSAPGPYYYGACVDAVAGESNTANNCSTSVQVTVLQTQQQLQGRPDLEVGTPTVSDTSPEPGASFTLSATVSNTGDGESVATTLRYYRSTDATVTTSDAVVGTDAVGASSASGTSAQSISLTAPATAGTYYYGACVDAVTDESDTTNNCSSSVTVTVLVVQQQMQGLPDLVVYAVVMTGSPFDGGPGSSFTLQTGIRNDGDGESAATTLRYYRSTDATITTSDTSVGTDAVGALAAAGTSNESTSLTGPSSPGAYYYGACVDAVAGESDPTNNCSSSVTVTVREPEPPDLVVGSPTVSDSSPAPGASFTLSAVVGNYGGGDAPRTLLRYYRSRDPSRHSPNNTLVGTDRVPALAAARISRQSIRQIAPRSPGTWYYYACAKLVAGELDTRNNCSPFVTVTVLPGSDLVVGSPTVSNSSPATGTAFTLSATVSNTGERASRSARLRYYRLTYTQVGTDAVPALNAAGTSSQSITLTAPSSPGDYYYYACVDAVTGESDSTNNCSSLVRVTVSKTPQLPAQPDLVVGSPMASNERPVSTGRVTLSATVSNTGDRYSRPTTLRYYRSTDPAITPSDTEVGTDRVPALNAAGPPSSQSILLTAPSPGTWYYGACVDAVTGESDTMNNCSSSVTVTVQPLPVPDLVVGSPMASNERPVSTGRFTLSATVSNTGDRYSPPTTLRYYRSTDPAITPSDTEVGTDAVPALNAAGISPWSILLTAPSPGTWYYGACVDAVTGESDTMNNCSSSVTVTVQPLPVPDLVVGSPMASNERPGSTARFTLSATVSNTGDRSSDSTTLRYYRSTDTTITTSDTEVGTYAVPALNAAGTSPSSILLNAPSPGTWYYGACVDAVTGESDTMNNCSSFVTVTVGPLPVPDLVVGSPTVSNSSPLSTVSFTLSATVSNTGGRSSPSTTLRYYRSADETITTADTEVGTDAVPALNAAGTSSQSVSLTAPSPGTWYYGACVDAVTGESDTMNNCSSSVQVNVGE